MSYYGKNPFDADWEAAAAEDQVGRVARAEEEAGRYFRDATKAMQAEYDATMRDLLGMTGPRWDRARAAAKAKWDADTAPAKALFDRTVECLLETGEVSDALDYEWTRLTDPAKAAEMWPERNPLLEVAKDALRVLTAHNLGDEIDLGYIEGVIAKAEADGRDLRKQEAA